MVNALAAFMPPSQDWFYSIDIVLLSSPSALTVQISCLLASAKGGLMQFG